MLKKQNRLDRKEIQAVFRFGNFKHWNKLKLIYKKNNLNFSRLAVIIGKKTTKKATQRNLLKRRARNAFNKVFNPFLENKKDVCYDFVLLIGSSDYKFESLVKDVEKLFYFVFKNKK
ncbi:MAG: ribonuclease P protein component [Candidatus Moranbacteria bacterium]|nr:ribonuclease P protein component [Candidatus Moranbacteria bacterium]